MSTHTDWPCVLVMLTLGGAVWGTMLPAVRRGAVLTPGATAALAGVTLVVFVAGVRALGPRVLRWPTAGLR